MLTPLEAAVIDKLLAGDDPWLVTLRDQSLRLRVARREQTGVGFFTHFELPDDAARADGRPTLQLGDVDADIEGLEHGAGFVLWVKDGAIAMLEGFSYDDAWQPTPDDRFTLRYDKQGWHWPRRG